MNLRFKNFEFYSEQQILLKDGEVVQLNAKQSQLLALFLSDVNKIHSKNDILDKVWPERVVTDQVVFQNISYIRSVCGDDAIKTFSKKGYQWQLPLSKINNVIISQQSEEAKLQAQNFKDSESDSEMPSSKSRSLSDDNQTSYSKHGIANVIIVVLALVILLLNQSTKNHLTKEEITPLKVTIVPNSQPDKVSAANEITAFLMTDEHLGLIGEGRLTSQEFFNSPFKTWQASSDFDEQILLSYKLYSLANNNADETILRFHLQGKNRGWQGNILGKSNESVATQLQLLLKTLQRSSYFILQSENAALAQLTLLLNTQPNNSLLKRQLIQLNFELGNYDIAAALVDHELRTSQHQIFIGIYHLFRSHIWQEQGNWKNSGVHVKRAKKIFAQFNISYLESLALIQASWVAFVDREYRLSREYLNAAANKARLAQEPLQEVEAHLTQAFMASKKGLNELKHSQLDLAKRLIKLHQLNDEHQITVLNNLAGAAHSTSERITHFQEIINTPFSALYKRDFYNAADYVRKALIKQKEFNKVLDSIKPWQRSSFTSVTRAQVEFSKEQWEPAAELALEAFNSARITHEHYDALDAALLLILIQERLAEGHDIAEYIDYISQNMTKRWQRMNKETMDELNYW